jgi:hypothetical protein
MSLGNCRSLAISKGGDIMLCVSARRLHLFRDLVLATVALLPQVASVPAQAEPKPVDATLIEQRLLAQQGLSVGLATVLLQSQFVAQYAVGLPTGQCVSPLGSGWGGMQSLSNFETDKAFGGHLRLYFDTACTHLYMDEKVKYRVRSWSPEDFVPDADITVFSRSGAKVGEFALSGRILGATAETHLRISATATFSPHDGSPQAAVAFTCELPPTTVDGVWDVDCAEGIAQNFPLIGMATASVNPLALHIVASDGVSSVTFTQNGHATLYTGAIDALSLSVSAKNKIVLGGGASLYGVDKLSGGTALFGLFPPRPTKWVAKDVRHNAEFAISLVSDVTRRLAGTIGPINGTTPLATISVDQSGTGRITYSDATSANVSSWVVGR